MSLFSSLSGHAIAATALALLPFTGAAYYAHAQSNAQERAVVEQALKAQGAEFRGGRRSDILMGSPDGNMVVVDLGEGEFNGDKTRSQAVYDFVKRKDYILRFNPARNQISSNRESLN